MVPVYPAHGQFVTRKPGFSGLKAALSEGREREHRGIVLLNNKKTLCVAAADCLALERELPREQLRIEAWTEANNQTDFFVQFPAVKIPSEFRL